VEEVKDGKVIFMDPNFHQSDYKYKMGYPEERYVHDNDWKTIEELEKEL